MVDITKGLNKSQKQAVLYNEGPLAIIAGAGSGKTKTLTHKIAYLIKEKNVSPFEILAVTFTNKAAREMKERIIKIIGKEGKDVRMYTYHAMCARILREDIEALGYRKRFNILDPIDQKQILRPAYKKLGLSNRTLQYRVAIDFISTNKNIGNTVEELREDAVKDVDHALVNLYEHYLKATKESNSLDFDDLLILTEKLFKENKDVAKKWADRFKYVLVDEFQDTSPVQYKIIKTIASKSIFSVVGDPDQTIYTWRFADPKLILNFNKTHKKSKVVLLEENYRSSKKILSAANLLIQKNKFRIEKNLFTSKKSGEDIEYFHGFSEDAEARWVVSQINELAKKKVQLKDIAILYRSNYLTAALEKALIEKNVKYFIFGGVKFYQREEIKDVVAYMKIIANGENNSLKRMINIPSRKIGASSQTKLFDFLEEKGNNIFELLGENFNNLPIAGQAYENLAKFINLVNKYNTALNTNKISVVIEKFLLEVSYLKKWSSFEDQGRAENIKELILMIKTWEKKNKNKDIFEYLQEISLYTDNNDAPGSDDYVSLMTIHSSKGLEFGNVFIFGLSETAFPSKRAISGPNKKDALEEERRLAYVAVTRAKERLFLSSSKGYAVDYQTQKTPSRFIKELGLNPQSFTKDFISPNSFEQNFKSNSLIEGDKVLHERFGGGIVVNIQGDIAEIAFKAPHGVKMLMKNHKSLMKVGE